jgi:hypothetical protein
VVGQLGTAEGFVCRTVPAIPGLYVVSRKSSGGSGLGRRRRIHRLIPDHSSVVPIHTVAVHSSDQQSSAEGPTAMNRSPNAMTSPI